MRYLLISAYILYISYDVEGNWRNYFKNTDYMTRTKSTTHHYKHKAYYTLESLYPHLVNRSTAWYEMDLTQMPEEGIPEELSNKVKWVIGNRTRLNKLGRARKAEAKRQSKLIDKKLKWETRFNWTYCEVPLNKSTYGKKPNIYLLYKSLLGGWKHNDLQQFWNVRLPNDGLI